MLQRERCGRSHLRQSQTCCTSQDRDGQERPSRHSHLPTGSTTYFWHIYPCRANPRSLLQMGHADVKTSHADSGVLQRQPGATSNSWGRLFPPNKALLLSHLKKMHQCLPDRSATLSPWNYFPVSSRLFSRLASCLHTERPQLQGSVDPSDAACIARFSDTPVSSDLRSRWFHQHTSSHFKSSFRFWQSSTKTAPGICLGNTSAHNTILRLTPPKLPVGILFSFP